MDPTHVCRAHGGTARWSMLRAHGVTRTELMRALEAREVARIGRGIYAVPEAHSATILSAAWHGRATCVTALKSWGLPSPAVDRRVHVAIRRERALSRVKRDTSDVRLHWYDGPVATAATVLGAIDIAALCLSDVDQLAAIDAALNRNLIGSSDLDRLAITPTSRAQWLREHCDPGCQSPPETYVRVAMREAGLPVRTQVTVPGVGRVDFVVDGAVVVEVDGKTYHMNERAFWEDRRRDRVTQIGGMMALRFTREDVEKDLAGVVAEVAAAVALVRQRTGRPSIPVRTTRPLVPWTRASRWSGPRR